jgi:hypothetical protein
MAVKTFKEGDVIAEIPKEMMFTDGNPFIFNEVMLTDDKKFIFFGEESIVHINYFYHIPTCRE